MNNLPVELFIRVAKMSASIFCTVRPAAEANFVLSSALKIWVSRLEVSNGLTEGCDTEGVFLFLQDITKKLLTNSIETNEKRLNWVIFIKNIE